MVKEVEGFRGVPDVNITAIRSQKPTIWSVNDGHDGKGRSDLWQNMVWLGHKVTVLMAERARTVKAAISIVGNTEFPTSSKEWLALDAGMCVVELLKKPCKEVDAYIRGEWQQEDAEQTQAT